MQSATSKSTLDATYTLILNTSTDPYQGDKWFLIMTDARLGKVKSDVGRDI